MNRIIIFVLLFFLAASCSIPYDGERRYIFETTVLDGGNNPLPNVPCNVVFYRSYSGSFLNRFSYDEASSDLITSARTDSNGKIRLVFPVAINHQYIKIEIGTPNNLTQQSLFEFINITEGDFMNFKLVEPAINIYNSNELVQLDISVVNTSNNKYISNVELIGQKRILFKDFDSEYTQGNQDPLFPKNYEIKKNQVVTLKYDVITQSANGQQSTTTIEEQITIATANVNYQISL